MRALQAYNGVVNGIDTVLLPPGVSLPAPPTAAASLQTGAFPPTAEGAAAAVPVSGPI